MANATNVRGPYPNLPVTTGIQTYYVDERLGSGSQIGRKIILCGICVAVWAIWK